jgi:hypothetical protein
MVPSPRSLRLAARIHIRRPEAAASRQVRDASEMAGKWPVAKIIGAELQPGRLSFFVTSRAPEWRAITTFSVIPNMSRSDGRPAISRAAAIR